MPFGHDILSLLQELDPTVYDIDNLLAAASNAYEKTNSVPNQASVSPSPLHATSLSLTPTPTSSTLSFLSAPGSSTLCFTLTASPTNTENSTTTCSSSSTTTTVRFAQPKTDGEVITARAAGIPKQTQKDTQYCVNTFEEWRKYRQ